MTSPLRRKRLTIAPAPSTPATTPARLAAAALLLLGGGLAIAQEPPPLPPLPPAPPAAWKPSAPEGRPLPPATHAGSGEVKKSSFVKHAEQAPAQPAAAPVELVQGFAPRPAPAQTNDQMDYLIQLLPPPRDRLFRLYNEDALREQIRQEGRSVIPRQPTVFPEEQPVTAEPYSPREFAPEVALAEPAYVNYKRLYFQDVNTERYGWELGFVQPIFSAGRFFADLAVVPYRFASRPFDCVESSAGYCLPDSPVPYLLYPPDLSVTGAMGEAGAILGLIAILP